MPLSMCYWIIMLIWLIFGLWQGLRPNGDRFVAGGAVILFELFVIIGMAVFGGPIQGK